MKFEIKNRFSGTVIIEIEAGSLKAAVELAIGRGANLDGANLYGANLDGANLYGANLDGANLYGANLRCANLRCANLRCANLYGANLYGANLYGANLRCANLDGANLDGANLDGANLDGAKLKDEVVTVGRIGSRKAGTIYNVSTDTVICGCFKGTFAEFTAKVESKYTADTRHGREYRAAISYFSELKKIVTEEGAK